MRPRNNCIDALEDALASGVPSYALPVALQARLDLWKVCDSDQGNTSNTY